MNDRDAARSRERPTPRRLGFGVEPAGAADVPEVAALSCPDGGSSSGTMDGMYPARSSDSSPPFPATVTLRPIVVQILPPRARTDRRRVYIITRPPSTARTWPVMYPASSDARNVTAFAMSWTVPKCRAESGP